MTVQERNVQTGCTWLTCSRDLKKKNRIQNTESVVSDYKSGVMMMLRGWVWVKESDGLGEETPPKSLSFWRLAVINGIMNSAVYQKILKDNVRPSVRDLKLKRTWVLLQDNDPKHTSKSTSEWLKKNKMKTLEWPSQSPDLNPIEMLWHDLKKAVHAQKPSNVAELQQFCQDEWAKIPPQHCNRLIASYRKSLMAVVAAKGGPTSY